MVTWWLHILTLFIDLQPQKPFIYWILRPRASSLILSWLQSNTSLEEDRRMQLHQTPTEKHELLSFRLLREWISRFLPTPYPGLYCTLASVSHLRDHPPATWVPLKVSHPLLQNVPPCISVCQPLFTSPTQNLLSRFIWITSQEATHQTWCLFLWSPYLMPSSLKSSLLALCPLRVDYKVQGAGRFCIYVVCWKTQLCSQHSKHTLLPGVGKVFLLKFG